MVFSDRDHLGQPDLAIAYLDRAADRMAALKARLLVLLSPLPGSCVLDLGCGAGHDLVALADREVTPIGVDFSEHMVRASRQRCESLGVRALVVRADGHRLPLQSSTVDGCRIERVLQHVDQPAAVVRDVFRVLRPGSRLVAFEPDWDSFVIESDDAALNAFISEAIASHVQQPHMGSDLRPLLRAAGFQSVECVPDPVEWSSFDSLRSGVGVEAILEPVAHQFVLARSSIPVASTDVVVNPWDSTFVTRVSDRRYSATIAPAWTLAMVPQGGVVAAIAARAMETEFGTGQLLRSFHGVFATPVPVGPVDIDVDVIRSGRSMSQVQATVHGAGAAAGFTALAAFGNERAGFAYTELPMPVVPEPEECVSFRDPPPPEAGMPDGPVFPFWNEVLEGRPALGHAPWDPSERGAAEVATWFRFDHFPRDAHGEFDQLALLVAADMMPSAVFEKLGGPEQTGWFAPSVDLTVHLAGLPTGTWILNHNRAHYAGDGYASAEAALWDPHGRDGPTLLAFATQIMVFTRFD